MANNSADAGEWFRTVVERFEGPLVRYAKSITDDTERARDVVQEAFLRLHKQNGSRPENVQAWLYTVCRRQALDIVRKETRMRTLDEAQAAICECPTPTQAAAFEQNEAQSQLVRVLGDLPANQQEVVRLKFQDALSYRDIAEITGLSISNVGYLLHVAIKQLREQLSASDK
jgi:RNA polymerase sigma-70 factor (ECF subfamily)